MLIMVVSLVGIHAVVSVLDPATELGLIFGYGFVPGAWTLWMFPGAEESILEQVIVDGAVDPRAATMVRMGLIEHPNSIFRSTDLRPAARLMVACTSERPVAGGLRNPGASTPRRGALHCAVCRHRDRRAGAHWVTNLHDFTPMVGASAVVSGMMGAAAWFVFARSSFGGGLIDSHAHLRRRETLAEMVRNQRTMVFFGIWFALNLLFGVGAAPLGITEGGIAWQAHIGGFLAGLILFPRIDPRG